MRRRGALLLISISLLFMIASALGEEEQAQIAPLTVPESIAELDRLASAVKELSNPQDLPALINSIPPEWRVQTGESILEVHSDWLRQSLRDWQKAPSHEAQELISTRLETFRSEAASFQSSSTGASDRRAALNQILAGREFQDVHGPTWLDRLKRRAIEMLIALLRRVFRASAIPTIRNIVVYGLMTLAVLAVAYWMYRTIQNNAGVEAVALHSL